MPLYFDVIVLFLYRWEMQIQTRIMLTRAGKFIKARSSDSLASTFCLILHPTRPLEEVFNEQVRKTSGKNWLLFLFQAEFLLSVLGVSGSSSSPVFL